MPTKTCLGVWLIILFLCSPKEWEHFHYVDMELGVTALSAFLLGLTQAWSKQVASYQCYLTMHKV